MHYLLFYLNFESCYSRTPNCSLTSLALYKFVTLTSAFCADFTILLYSYVIRNFVLVRLSFLKGFPPS